MEPEEKNKLVFIELKNEIKKAAQTIFKMLSLRKFIENYPKSSVLGVLGGSSLISFLYSTKPKVSHRRPISHVQKKKTYVAADFVSIFVKTFFSKILYDLIDKIVLSIKENQNKEKQSTN